MLLDGELHHYYDVTTKIIPESVFIFCPVSVYGANGQNQKVVRTVETVRTVNMTT